MNESRHVLITGGAGYIGAYLTGELLRRGYYVTVVDDLLYGGESLLAYFPNEKFNFRKADVWETRAIKAAARKDWPVPFAVVHLAGIAGFPACQSVGRLVAWRYNVEATQHVYEQAVTLGVQRFVYISSYSNYALQPDGKPATEESPLNPQSLYGETKVACERYLLSQDKEPTASIILRAASAYGLSPRPRFDVIVNQFVYDAYFKRKLMIYQRGYSRSFIHIADLVRGIMLALQSPIDRVRGEVFNLGSADGNLTKDQIVTYILKRLPETQVIYKDLTFGGDMRDLLVSYEKIETQLGFKAKLSIDDGIREVLHALQMQIIRNPHDERYRNATFIVQ